MKDMDKSLSTPPWESKYTYPLLPLSHTLSSDADNLDDRAINQLTASLAKAPPPYHYFQNRAIYQLAKDPSIELILETGTLDGTGASRCMVAGLEESGTGRLISIEAMKDWYDAVSERFPSLRSWDIFRFFKLLLMSLLDGHRLALASSYI